jgi:hypothetical protein
VASGTEARWYGSETDVKIALDGRPLGDPVSQGLELKDLSAGTHELIFTGPGGQQDKMLFEPKPSPAVYVKVSLVHRGKP